MGVLNLLSLECREAPVAGEEAAVCGSGVLRREVWAGDVNLRVIRIWRLINAMGVEDLLIER